MSERMIDGVLHVWRGKALGWTLAQKEREHYYGDLLRELAALRARVSELEGSKPTICVGEFTIAALRRGETVEVSTAILIPASDLYGPSAPALRRWRRR
jgi:hypothetical protein